MQTLDEMLVERDVLTGKILRTISDMRADEEVKETVRKLFSYFPDCNGFVLMAAYKGDNGERAVYSFDEVEESYREGMWFSELYEDDEYLRTINSWVTNHRPGKWEPEIDDLFEHLASIYPAPIEEEIDWDGMDLDSKFEVLILKSGEYV